ncbi:MAG TPA: hypothetical protein VEK74_07565 [Burkholderiaceae bacterium]|nr:hypothetical protein [Burkholderiaceae bacterium]
MSGFLQVRDPHRPTIKRHGYRAATDSSTMTRSAMAAGMPPGVPASRGYALLFALITVATVSLGAVIALLHQRVEAQRQRELQLLFVGEQFRAALRHYFDTPGVAGVQEYPKTLDDLVLDQRKLVAVRHIRRIYPDPITGKSDWVLEKMGDRIVGVHSRSIAVPLLKAGFTGTQAGFDKARSYEDWRFSALEPAADSAAGNSPSGVPAVSAQAASFSTGGTADATSQASTNAAQQAALNASSDCFQNYQAPQAECGDTPPPHGNNQVQCIRYLQQLYNACMASAGLPQ